MRKNFPTQSMCSRCYGAMVIVLVGKNKFFGRAEIDVFCPYCDGILGACLGDEIEKLKHRQNK